MSGSDSGPGAPPISANNESNKPSSADSGGWPVKKARATPGHPLQLRPWFYAHICDMCSLADWNVKPLLPTKMPLDKLMAALQAESWEIDFVSLPWCLQPVKETITTPPSLSRWMSYSREEESRQIISTKPLCIPTARPYGPTAQLKQALPRVFFFYAFRCQAHPYYFLFGRHARSGFSALFYLMTPLAQKNKIK